MFVNHLTVLLIVKYLNLNVKLYVLNLFAIGNVLNHYVLNLSANWFVKTPLVDLKLNAVNATNLAKEFNKWCSLKNKKKIKNVVNVTGISLILVKTKFYHKQETCVSKKKTYLPDLIWHIMMEILVWLILWTLKLDLLIKQIMFLKKYIQNLPKLFHNL